MGRRHRPVQPPDPFPDPLSFHISETTNFNVAGLGPNCRNTNLNNVGQPLANFIASIEGWPGTYLLNGQTTPTTFREATFAGIGGNDTQFADFRRVSIYAGHGNVGSLQWGVPGALGPNDCFVGIPQQVRLGQLGGATSGFAMWITSCTANVTNDQIVTNLASDAMGNPINLVGQQLGWHNSPAVADGMPRDFFIATGTSVCDPPSTPCSAVTNRAAFMSLGQHRPGIGWNSPVVFSQGTVIEEVNERHFESRLRQGVGIELEIEEPQRAFRYTMVNNGGC